MFLIQLKYVFSFPTKKLKKHMFIEMQYVIWMGAQSWEPWRSTVVLKLYPASDSPAVLVTAWAVPPEFWFSTSSVGSANLYVLQVPIWCWVVSLGRLWACLKGRISNLRNQPCLYFKTLLRWFRCTVKFVKHWTFKIE